MREACRADRLREGRLRLRQPHERALTGRQAQGKEVQHPAAGAPVFTCSLLTTDISSVSLFVDIFQVVHSLFIKQSGRHSKPTRHTIHIISCICFFNAFTHTTFRRFLHSCLHPALLPDSRVFLFTYCQTIEEVILKKRENRVRVSLFCL